MLSQLYRCAYQLRTRKRLIQTLIAIPAFVLGYLACREQYPLHEWWTVAYRTLQMFVLELDPIDPKEGVSEFDTSLKFAVAHWLAMILAASVIFEVLLHFSSQWTTSGLIRIFGGKHVILCGLGENSLSLIDRLLAAGHQVVAIEPDESHSLLEECRKRGVVIFIGDPTAELQLRKARLDSAGHVLAIFKSDEVNYEVARTAFEMCLKVRQEPLGCVLQIRDRPLLEILNREELKTNLEDNFELEVFHSDEVLSRLMLREASWVSTASAPRRILVMLSSDLEHQGETFLVRAARDWLIEANSSGSPVEVTLVGEAATRIDSHIALCFPDLYQRITMSLWDRGPETWSSLEHHPQTPLDPQRYDVAFVLGEREERTLIGVNLLQRISKGTLPVVVSVEEASRNFRKLLPRDPSNKKQAAPNIRVISAETSVFDVEMVLHPESELLAQACHQDYLIDHLSRGAMDKASVTSWSDLEETYRISNRALASRLLEYISGKIPGTRELERTYLSDRPVRLFQFTPEEIEILAEEEHRRWKAEREKQGWRFGKPRDNEKKLHPDLVDFAELDEPTRELDRNIIRRIPFVFAKMDVELSEKR